MVTHDVEVLVAGLGPAGSVLTLFLAQQGIKVAAIDVAPRGGADLRASTFHPPTIEILDQMGVSNALLSYGLKAPIYQYVDRKSKERFSFDLGEIADSTRFPYRIQCEQHKVAHEIAEKLDGMATASLSYQTRLLHVSQESTGVTALVETPLAIEQYKARYVVGADGANSVVRKLLDLSFDGFTYHEKYLCLSTEYPVETAFEHLASVNYVSDPDEWLVLLRVPTLWRILVPAGLDVADDTLLSDAVKDQVFARILGENRSVATRHRTIYRVHQRVASHFAVGRIAIIGDAAHLNSPMGGFGMNSGIHDAVNLGDKLLRILRKSGDPALIGLFERQRRTVTVDFVQAQTVENMTAMRLGWGGTRDTRRDRMMSLQRDSESRRAFLLKQAMITSLTDAARIQ